MDVASCVLRVGTMRLLKFLGFVSLITAVVLVVVLALGAALPRAHVASATVVVPAPQARVWSMLVDTPTQPQWREGLVAVQPLPSKDGHPCWLEMQKYGKMPLCEVASTPPSQRTVLIADPTLPFGGTWVYQLSPVGPDSTQLTITENGTTGPLLWRFMGHYVFHEDTMIKQYQASLLKAVSAKP